MSDHNTRSKSITNLEEAILKLTVNQNEITTRLYVIASQLSSRDIQSPHSGTHSSFHSDSPPFTPHLCLDVPRFDGTDPMGWIFKISQFFEYHPLQKNRILLTSTSVGKNSFLSVTDNCRRNFDGKSSVGNMLVCNVYRRISHSWVITDGIICR